MYLNSIKPNKSARKKSKRVGRGIGSGSGKTCCRGHKGQKSRSGGFHKIGFEGGQMPIHRRIPKSGFISRLKMVTAELRLDALNKIKSSEISVKSLKKEGVIKSTIERVKIISSGSLEKAVKVKGLMATKAAKEAIIKAGGSIED